MSLYRPMLISILREKSVRTGSFTLRSGRKSDLYVDARQTTLSAEGSWVVARMIIDVLRPDIVGVGGLTLGADPIACSVAATSLDYPWPPTGTRLIGAGLPTGPRPICAFLIRREAKDHGTSSLVEGLANLPQDSPVCIVEDVTTTGESLLVAVRAARDAGLSVVQCVTVVDREEGAVEAVAAAGLELQALTRRSDLV